MMDVMMKMNGRIGEKYLYYKINIYQICTQNVTKKIKILPNCILHFAPYRFGFGIRFIYASIHCLDSIYSVHLNHALVVWKQLRLSRESIFTSYVVLWIYFFKIELQFVIYLKIVNSLKRERELLQYPLETT